MEYPKFEFRKEDFTEEGQKEMKVCFKILENYIKGMKDGEAKKAAEESHLENCVSYLDKLIEIEKYEKYEGIYPD